MTSITETRRPYSSEYISVLIQNNIDSTVMTQHGPSPNVVPSLESLMSLDQHELTNIQWDVRQIAYGLSCSMSYGLFSYILSEYRRSIRHDGFLRLAVLPWADDEEARWLIYSLPLEAIEGLRNIVVRHIATSPANLMCLPTADVSSMDIERKVYMLPHTSGIPITITFELCKLNTLTPRTRDIVWRLKYAENPSLSPRTMLLLLQVSFPVALIPGITSADNLRYKAVQSSTVYEEMVTRPDKQWLC